ncbi:hypothetical protein [Nocardia terpenica]|uniref:Uncharacterized protein n=1 Tax=Nocardia terpenica TaxID=455432 RepID=A0A291RZ08_9NOCA|nr:hypothetical protein [Nocardia terpenica]ATL72518.1 hypothetical protein CRH09_39805 [Nocardia terpenica]
MSETSAADERAILTRSRAAQAAYAAGDHATAHALHDDLVALYGLTAIATVMAARYDREQLGIEAQLLGIFGPTLYGENR